MFYAPTVGFWTCILQKNVLVQSITPSLSMATLDIRVCFLLLSAIRDVPYMIREICISIHIPQEEGDLMKSAFAGKVLLNFECIIQY